MTTYKAPTEDIMFLFNELSDNKHFKEIDEYKEVNTELVQSIISEAAKILGRQCVVVSIDIILINKYHSVQIMEKITYIYY